ncbi:Rv1733c family protein [Actinopolyspora mortivallis]|uniref:Rv1733c family protein n=1 Tax=Actinopolyspora mortivallis TaxID=33906 RepID=UPI00037783F6|nr:hypothetical protein [Actinopolyspora mortivallis]
MGESVLRAVRLLRPGASPLARVSDRVEGVLLVFVVLLPVLSLPVSLVIGSQTYAEQLRLARQQENTRTPVMAVLTEDAVATVPRARGSTMTEASASWSSPDGRVRTGTVAVRAGARKWESVRIWIDAEGRKVPAPLTESAAFREASAAVLSCWLAVLFGSTAVFWGTRWVLDRLRWRAWEREWNSYGRLWGGFHGSGSGET